MALDREEADAKRPRFIRRFGTPDEKVPGELRAVARSGLSGPTSGIITGAGRPGRPYAIVDGTWQVLLGGYHVALAGSFEDALGVAERMRALSQAGNEDVGAEIEPVECDGDDPLLGGW